MRYVAITMLVAVLAGFAAANQASVRGDMATVYIQADDANIRVAYKDGNTFFSAPIGSEYTISIRNNTGRRILAVPTVDGLNVIDRNKGDWGGTGYVIAPHGSVEIPGFRRSDQFQYVERFTFNEARFSLAKRIGDVRNVGVIGVALFKEYVPPPPEPVVHNYDAYPQSSRYEESANESRMKCETYSRAGTEAGRTVHDPVRRVSFQRASNNPEEILALYYDKEENLISAGILPPPYNPPPRGFLSPFPSNYAKGID